MSLCVRETCLHSYPSCLPPACCQSKAAWLFGHECCCADHGLLAHLHSHDCAHTAAGQCMCVCKHVWYGHMCLWHCTRSMHTCMYILCAYESGKYMSDYQVRKLNRLYHSNMAMFATDAAVCMQCVCGYGWMWVCLAVGVSGCGCACVFLCVCACVCPYM